MLRDLVRKLWNTVLMAVIVLSPAILMGVFWEFAIGRSQRARFLFGCPSLVLESLYSYVSTGPALVDMLTTGGEASAGFIAGNLIGLVLGLGLAYLPKVQHIAKWYIAALGAVPIFALAPMIIMWFGIGFMSKFMMAVFSTFLVTTVQSYTGATQANADYIRLMRSFGASDWQIFRNISIPSSITFVVSSFKLTIGFALLGAFIGEFISADRGLGYRILKAGGLYDIPGVLAAVLLIVVLALALNLLIDLLGYGLLRWKRNV